MKIASLLALALMFTATAGCAVEAGAARPDQEEIDMGFDAGAHIDARPDTLPTSPVPTPDAGHADALPARAEASTDAGQPVTSDAQPVQHEAASADSGRVDALVVDAGREAAPAAADCTTEGACSCGSPSSVATLTREIDLVRSTFASSPCSSADEPKCGGVQDDPRIVSTLPLVCTNGAWTYKVYWYSCEWMQGGPPCTARCAAGRLCNP